MKHRGVVCVTRSVAEVYLTYSMDEHFQFKLPYDTDSISMLGEKVNEYFSYTENFPRRRRDAEIKSIFLSATL